jgi:hypothetical protein
MLVSMEALHMGEGPRYGLRASIEIPPEGDGSGVATATVSVSTSALVVLVGAGILLSQGVGLGRLQGAVPAFAERVGDRLAAAA